MWALVVIDTVVVALLAVLVAGLLRSHADILRALHQLGAGVGDPVEAGDHVHGPAAGGASGPVPVPFGRADSDMTRIGPPLPPERDTTHVVDLVGVDPSGDAVAVAVGEVEHDTLLAFLSSGCSTCATLWDEITTDSVPLPRGVRVVVVTKGPEFEVSAEVRAKARGAVVVVMSTQAWVDYEVPGSPFFVLIEGNMRRRIGEGLAGHLAQVLDMVRRARADTEDPRVRSLASMPARIDGLDSLDGVGPDGWDGLDGPAREARNDALLLAAGIGPGDPSLYPVALGQVIGGTTERSA